MPVLLCDSLHISQFFIFSLIFGKNNLLSVRKKEIEDRKERKNTGKRDVTMENLNTKESVQNQ
jgi:hypothetical protein